MKERQVRGAVRRRLSRRRLLATAGAVFATSLLARRAGAQQTVSLRVSSSYPASEKASHYVWFESFASHLKEETSDRIRFEYFPNSQLGGEAEVVEQVKIGSIDMMLTGPSIWATVAPEIGMLDLGYLFNSYPHLAKALDAGAGDALAKILADRTGVMIVGWGFHFGARSVYTKRPAAGLADIRNVKLRVLPAPAFVETFKIMGATPTPIPFNELYTALQTGVVDGFEHDPGTCLALKFYEVTKYCLLTEHLFGPMCAFLGRRAFTRIPDEVKPAFLKAASRATVDQRAIARDRIMSVMEELRGLGVAFTPMPQEERRAMQNEMADKLYADFAKQYPATRPIFAAIAAARA